MIGKIFGSAVGAIFGFPGLVLGLMAGHYADVRLSRNNQDFLRDAHAAGINIGGNMDQVAFTVGIVVLGAKMAKVDGKVTRSEIEAFKRVFQIPSQHEAQIGALFDQARQDAAGYEAYAAQLARLFHARPAVLEELLTGLMLIAAADAGIVPEGRKISARCRAHFRVQPLRIQPDRGA
ncbi:MAG: TerB family tellurite resistance protein [Alphaproteobacteria bacterium]